MNLHRHSNASRLRRLSAPQPNINYNMFSFSILLPLSSKAVILLAFLLKMAHTPEMRIGLVLLSSIVSKGFLYRLPNVIHLFQWETLIMTKIVSPNKCNLSVYFCFTSNHAHRLCLTIRRKSLPEISQKKADPQKFCKKN